ncbi:L-threonylcarbamoyladenylate synthase [Actibacterium sp. 188UL27-1]|uniref:L-threonylcarbamoyladenylate synthase n=1 Tax=Actibacterium sp. 188UL27-1 TaxID=2786961 RepID=UPI00195711FD|nr:L-threonylcarbamoyladenylate synthase [Actibacterium sp. 188UL27-1]MBM7068522.1 threonylcarbamoyl-AMP synthase [Actibacterium sp. 188UL27-1]
MPKQTRLLRPDRTGLTDAVDMLRGGGLVAFPTETVYGLGADARNAKAVAGIYAAKGRPQFNPLIVHVADLASACDIAVVKGQALELAKAFWPGPLTLVVALRSNGGIADLVTAGLHTVAIRVPAGKVAQDLLSRFDGPIAAPSANPSGRISPTHADHVMAGLEGQIDAIVDGGPCSVGLESTIIGFDGRAAQLLRPGGLSAENIEKHVKLAVPTPDTVTITAPGQLASHYAPRAALRLNATALYAEEVLLGFGPNLPDATVNLSTKGDLVEAAANLFGYLHRMDDMGCPIAVSPIPNHGLGQAINDRLRRAAAPR